MDDDFYAHYDDDCEIPLRPVTPPVWKDDFSHLTQAELETIYENWPTREEVQSWWAKEVARMPATERQIAIAAKLTVLDGIVPDPHAWVEEALRRETHG